MDNYRNEAEGARLVEVSDGNHAYRKLLTAVTLAAKIAPGGGDIMARDNYSNSNRSGRFWEGRLAGKEEKEEATLPDNHISSLYVPYSLV